MSHDHDDRDTDRTPGDEALARTARERVEQVSPEVAQRLAQMRRAAVTELDRLETRAGARRSPGLWIGSAVATAAAVMLTVALLLPPSSDPQPEAVLLADAEALEAIAELDVLEELEFLAWLEEEQLDAGRG